MLRSGHTLLYLLFISIAPTNSAQKRHALGNKLIIWRIRYSRAHHSDRMITIIKSSIDCWLSDHTQLTNSVTIELMLQLRAASHCARSMTKWAVAIHCGILFEHNIFIHTYKIHWFVRRCVLPSISFQSFRYSSWRIVLLLLWSYIHKHAANKSSCHRSDCHFPK